MPISAPIKKNDTVWFSSTETHYVSPEDKTTFVYRSMKPEQRGEARLEIKDGVFSVIDSYAPQICKIMEMSTSGLSYMYFKGDEAPYESLTMDILVTGFGFCLERIPFRKVEDYRADLEPGNGVFEKRVACIEFVDLSDAQTDQIKAFINNHVKKTVN